MTWLSLSLALDPRLPPLCIPILICLCMICSPFVLCFMLIRSCFIAINRYLKNTTHEPEQDIESGQLPSSVTAPSKPEVQQQQQDWSHCYTTIDYRMEVNGTGSCIGDQCTICLGKFEEEEDECVMLRNCKHAYHRKCINRWLPESCPVCRQSINGAEK